MTRQHYRAQKNERHIHFFLLSALTFFIAPLNAIWSASRRFLDTQTVLFRTLQSECEIICNKKKIFELPTANLFQLSHIFLPFFTLYSINSTRRLCWRKVFTLGRIEWDWALAVAFEKNCTREKKINVLLSESEKFMFQLFVENFRDL